MKIKKIILMIFVVILTAIFSGCASITCTLNLNEDGKIDINSSILYSDKEFSYNNESIEKVKKEFSDKGFKISEINENGMLGFSVSKDDVNLKGLNEILVKEYGIDIKETDLSDLDFDKGFLYNSYDVDTDIDLTSFSKIGSITDGNGSVITGEELQKVFSHLSLKLIIKMDKGTILETNSKLLSEDKKTAEWVLIPGTKSDIELEAITTSPLPVIGTVVIIGVVFILAVMLLIILTKMYIKRKKECNKE